MNKLGIAISLAAVALFAVPASAGTVHTEFYYSGTGGTNDGGGLYPNAPTAFNGTEADSAYVDFSYQTNDPNSFGANATHDLVASQDVYWSEEPHTLAQGLFGDWAYDNANFGTGSLQITLNANPGFALTNVSFDAFCARASGCGSETYKFYSVVGNTWTLLSSGTLAAFTSTDVTNGTLLTVATAVSEAAKIVFQIGSDGYVGIDNVKYDVSIIPLPGAMVLLGSALAGVAGIGYRRRRDQASA